MFLRICFYFYEYTFIYFVPFVLRDLSVQYLLDHLCKITYFVHGQMDLMVNLLMEQFQVAACLYSMNYLDI